MVPSLIVPSPSLLAAAATVRAACARSTTMARASDAGRCVAHAGSAGVNTAAAVDFKLDALDEIFKLIQPLHVLSGHISEVLALVACDHSPLVLSGSSDCTVKVRVVQHALPRNPNLPNCSLIDPSPLPIPSFRCGTWTPCVVGARCTATQQTSSPSP